MKKYIKTFESFRESKETVNEEFVGALFKGLKNKISLGFSKMFGYASKVEKLMQEYKKEIITAQSKKRESLKALGDYFKAMKNGAEKDQTEIEELKKNINLADKNYDDQLKLVKQKFDIKFNAIVKEEDNPKIKDYIKLKKIEMQQELLIDEMSLILSNGVLEEDDIDDPQFKEVIDDIKNKTEASKKMVEDQKKALEAKGETELGFDVEKARELANKGDVYLWENSPMKDYTFKKGDEIKYFSQSNKASTNATVLEEGSGERIKVETESGNEIEINRGVIISSSNFKKENEDSDSKETEKVESKPVSTEV